MNDDQQARTVVNFEDVKSIEGKDLGRSEWRTITQEMVNTFAVLADDRQWIHVDPERAKRGPFGAPIAHGFLTLSLIIPLWSELFDVRGAKTKLNYGLDKVRFISPVKVSSRVRIHAVAKEILEVGDSGIHLVTDVSVEIEGEERPAAVATFLARFYA